MKHRYAYKRLYVTLIVMALVFGIFLAGPGCSGSSSSSDTGQNDGSILIDGGLISGKTVGEAGDVIAYLGIPFAAPPVGDLRWKPPQPVESWEGVLDCTEFGPSCPQPSSSLYETGIGPTSEDCLYLNVWVKANPEQEDIPVMVWIHGGGHINGSGSMDYYNGENFTRQGVVLVTINYRLGPFGYFAHPLLSEESENGVSGNYGLLDQIAALEWVQNNIAAFGGDPQLVTVFGESAGSMSVCRLMISPLAEGLFQRAIAESGGVHTDERNLHLKEEVNGYSSMEQIGVEISTELGCESAADPLAALRAVSAEELLDASNPSVLQAEGANVFGPIIDGWAIPDDPRIMWASGLQHDVPFMTGSNANEGTIFILGLPLQSCTGYDLYMEEYFGEDAEAFLEFFPCESEGGMYAALDKLITVYGFVYPARFLVRSMAGMQSPAYLYHFTRIPVDNLLSSLGAFHSYEIGYVFGNKIYEDLLWEETDWNLSAAMQSYWINFAKSGDPNGAGLPYWEAYDTAQDNHMELGDEVKSGQNLYRDECDFFETMESE